MNLVRRCMAEFIGTFWIVFCPVALSATGGLSGGEDRLLAAALVSGLSVTVMIYSIGHISGAHYNPAVTLGFAAAKRFPWKHVPHYWFAQFGGAVFAAFGVSLLFGYGHGTHAPSGSFAQSILMEALLTFLLMLVIIAVATEKRVNTAVPGLAIGLAVLIDVLIGGPISGGSMNPARSLGPGLMAGTKSLLHYWIYLAGPCTGAILGARTYEAIRRVDTT